MDPARLSRVLLSVQEAIRQAYTDGGTRLFWPTWFIDLGLGTEAEVVEALLELVRRDQLVATIKLACENDHRAWEGAPADVEGAILRVTCRDCGAPLARESMRFRFEITRDWAGAIAGTGGDGAQKKTSSSRLESRPAA